MVSCVRKGHQSIDINREVLGPTARIRVEMSLNWVVEGMLGMEKIDSAEHSRSLRKVVFLRARLFRA